MKKLIAGMVVLFSGLLFANCHLAYYNDLEDTNVIVVQDRSSQVYCAARLDYGTRSLFVTFPEDVYLDRGIIELVFNDRVVQVWTNGFVINDAEQIIWDGNTGLQLLLDRSVIYDVVEVRIRHFVTKSKTESVNDLYATLSMITKNNMLSARYASNGQGIYVLFPESVGENGKIYLRKGSDYTEFNSYSFYSGSDRIVYVSAENASQYSAVLATGFKNTNYTTLSLEECGIRPLDPPSVNLSTYGQIYKWKYPVWDRSTVDINDRDTIQKFREIHFLLTLTNCDTVLVSVNGSGVYYNNDFNPDVTNVINVTYNVPNDGAIHEYSVTVNTALLTKTDTKTFNFAIDAGKTNITLTPTVQELTTSGYAEKSLAYSSSTKFYSRSIASDIIQQNSVLTWEGMAPAISMSNYLTVGGARGYFTDGSSGATRSYSIATNVSELGVVTLTINEKNTFTNESEYKTFYNFKYDNYYLNISYGTFSTFSFNSKYTLQYPSIVMDTSDNSGRYIDLNNNNVFRLNGSLYSAVEYKFNSGYYPCAMGYMVSKCFTSLEGSGVVRSDTPDRSFYITNYFNSSSTKSFTIALRNDLGTQELSSSVTYNQVYLKRNLSYAKYVGYYSLTPINGLGGTPIEINYITESYFDFYGTYYYDYPTSISTSRDCGDYEIILSNIQYYVGGALNSVNNYIPLTNATNMVCNADVYEKHGSIYFQIGDISISNVITDVRHNRPSAGRVWFTYHSYSLTHVDPEATEYYSRFYDTYHYVSE